MSLYRLKSPVLLTWDSKGHEIKNISTADETTETLTLTGGSTVYVSGSPGSSNTFSYDVVTMLARVLANDTSLTSANAITSLTYKFHKASDHVSIHVPVPSVGAALPNLITIFGTDLKLATWFASSDLAETVFYEVIAHIDHDGETNMIMIAIIIAVIVLVFIIIFVIIYFMMKNKSHPPNFNPYYRV